MNRFHCCMFLLAAFARGLLMAQSTNGLINSFETTNDLARFSKNNATVTLSTTGVTEGAKSAMVVFNNVDWPNIYFRTNSGFTNADWRPWGGLAFDVVNTNAESVQVDVRVDDDFSANGVIHCQTGDTFVPANTAITVTMPFTNTVPAGMKGGPPLIYGALKMYVSGSTLDWSHIVAFQIFLPKPGKSRTLFIDNIRLLPIPDLTGLADQYGQYTGGDWPGKIHGDAEFQTQNTNEQQWLAANPKPADRDQYGGWKFGPKFNATGFFRTAFIWNGQETNVTAVPTNQGRWWIIAPSGRLFFSMGIDVINYGENSPVVGRESLFTWLPTTGDPLLSFAPFGTSRNANFYGMNLYRKYGTNWQSLARTRAFDRLDSWGMNTIGNWSQSDLFSRHRVPYTVSVGYSRSGVATFYPTTTAMPDVYDTNFPAKVAAGLSNAVYSWKSDPWCLGYFVENELPWSGWGSSTNEKYLLPITVLSWTNPIPSKAEFSRLLQTRYAGIGALNTAWNTSIGSWDDISSNVVTLPTPPTPACVTDLSLFLSNFARLYFTIVSTNMERYASNQLYLGCRFASRPTEAVNVSSEYCDVISFNIYNRYPDTNTWAFTRALNKPAIIGEFHCGALDRGMFHPGLVQAKDQTDRGVMYQQYLTNVLAMPAFVGCHWFQYDDEPLTGRFDGENYNIGFVSGVDTPYWEIITAARQMLSSVYSRFAPTTNIPPVILTHPTNQTWQVGSTGTLVVETYGWPPPSYQWRKDGTDVPGAISDSLTYGGASYDNAGAYSVIVSNVAGIVTSAVARVTMVAFAPATLVPAGSAWRYFDRTNDLGTAWRSNSYNDSSWSSGAAMLGFGDASGLLPTTVIGSNKQMTTYFRSTIYVPSVTAISNLTARMVRDDGAVVYLNGAEVWRDNMPSGIITNLTPATNAISGSNESNWLTRALSPANLIRGTNLIAVEIHQNTNTSSDLLFNFELTGTAFFTNETALVWAGAGASRTFSWPADAGLFTLYSATNLNSPVSWSAATNRPVLSNGQWIIQLPGATNGNRYYRLQSQ